MERTNNMMKYVIVLAVTAVALFIFAVNDVFATQTPAEEAIATAEASEAQCAVTFEGDFGDDVTAYTIIVDKGEPLPFVSEAPNGTGTFVGWADGDKLVEAGDIIKSDVRLRPVFR